MNNILFFGLLSLIGLLFIANLWGNDRCNNLGGNWVSMNGGKYCVDDNFVEIDIYSK